MSQVDGLIPALPLMAGDGSSSWESSSRGTFFSTCWRLDADPDVGKRCRLLRPNGSQPSMLWWTDASISVPSPIPPAPPPQASLAADSAQSNSTAPRLPHSGEGSMTALPSFLPGFGTNVTMYIVQGRRRREPANI
ncbi:hypothetical protein PO909_008567 [Leuciscus waleckii]